MHAANTNTKLVDTLTLHSSVATDLTCIKLDLISKKENVEWPQANNIDSTIRQNERS